MTEEVPEREPEEFLDRDDPLLETFDGPLDRFVLVRVEDTTGVSGTGVVGVGVELPDGTAVFMWTNDQQPDGPDTNENSVYVYPGGMHDVREVHGHGGKTVVEWIDRG